MAKKPRKNPLVRDLYRGPYRPRQERSTRGKGSYRRKPKHPERDQDR